jgi:hypothetical protein
MDGAEFEQKEAQESKGLNQTQIAEALDHR